jgi:hypothetical protein
MLKIIDRTFGVLLILATCGHTAGTILLLPAMTGMWVWSLGAALSGYLLGALNLVRAGRPWDRTLALITTLGMACWILVALAFNRSIGNMLDPPGLGHSIIAFVLLCFSLRTLLQRGNAADGATSSPLPVRAS